MHRVPAFSCNNLCPTYQDDWAGTAARFDANFSLGPEFSLATALLLSLVLTCQEWRQVKDLGEVKDEALPRFCLPIQKVADTCRVLSHGSLATATFHCNAGIAISQIQCFNARDLITCVLPLFPHANGQGCPCKAMVVSCPLP